MAANPKRGANHTPYAISIALVCLTLLAYVPLWSCGFVNYDDPDYVTENRHVVSGLNADSISWAFASFHAGNWHPLTWLSHALDCHLWRLNPVPHHLTNLALHIANALLLFALVRRLTNRIWVSGVVAGLFALHPMHIESVAWIAERKDVLCGLFWMASTLMYVRYTEAKDQSGRRKFYVLTLVCFVLGLLSKPMIVTLPVVFMLMDYWPLRRLDLLSWKRCAVEKVPFIALSAVVSAITILAQNTAGAVRDFGALPLVARIENAAVAVFRYIYKLVWPVDLAVLYPYEKWPATTIVAAVVGFLAVASLTFVWRKRYPWLAFGWFWFVISLLPVIGVVQVGMQSIADRYTYIPSIGLFVTGSMVGAEFLKKFSSLRIMGIVVTCVVLEACGWITFRQVHFWRDTEVLLSHTLAATKNNLVAHNNLGFFLQEQGRLDEALAHFQAAEKIDNENPETHNNLACVFLIQGKLDESIEESSCALKLRPNFPEAQVNLGRALFLKGDSAKSLELLSTAIESVPENATAHFDLAEALMKHGQSDQAFVHFARALELNPTINEARLKMATVYLAKGELGSAAAQYRKVLLANPDSVECLNNLAWILATAHQDNLRNGAEAVKLAERVMSLGGTNSFSALDTMAAAYAEAARFSDAIRVVDAGIPLADVAGSPAAGRMRARRELYRSHQPYHEP